MLILTQTFQMGGSTQSIKRKKRQTGRKGGLKLQTHLAYVSSFESDVASEFQELSHNK